MSNDPHEPDAESNWYVLVCGVPAPSEPVVLGQGLALRGLPARLSVFDLAAAGAAGLREWAVLEPIAPACGCELESALDATLLPGYDTLNRAWLAVALLVLRGYSSALGVAASTYSWGTVAGHTKRAPPLDINKAVREGYEAAIRDPARQLPPFKGQVLDFHRRLFLGASPRSDPLTVDDAAWLHSHYETFNRLAAESAPFRLALEAVVDWRYASEPRAAVARLWTGIEAVFGLSSELVYRVSLLCASLLEPRGPTRRTRFKAVKTLYGLRSKMVHGEPLPDDKVGRAVQDSFGLLRDLLLLAIERGHALTEEDFDAAIFG